MKIMLQETVSLMKCTIGSRIQSPKRYEKMNLKKGRECEVRDLNPKAHAESFDTEIYLNKYSR